ncbi:hypothetical protein ACOSQ4_027782 [Xanthoceras sorbifolium]
MFDDETNDTQAISDQKETEFVEERLQAAYLPICVIQHVLTGCKKKEDRLGHNWKRTNIFYTKVEHRDKALNVIINNGSSTNVVAKEVVDQLSLPQETYPTPYKVSWINESNSVLVQTRFLVKFSLGKNYADQVWCDVILMTVCHLLLGRP